MRFVYTKAFPNTPPRPYLDVFLRNGYFTTSQLLALVDSGADYAIFPIETAEQLKLDLAKGQTWRFQGTTGQTQEAKLADVTLTILQENDKDHAFEVPVTCAFCDTFKFSGGALLGQNGFFSSFKISFCQSDNCFEIEDCKAA